MTTSRTIFSRLEIPSQRTYRTLSQEDLKNQNGTTRDLFKTQYWGLVHITPEKFENVKADLHDTTFSHATSLRQAYDISCFV